MHARTVHSCSADLQEYTVAFEIQLHFLLVCLRFKFYVSGGRARARAIDREAGLTAAVGARVYLVCDVQVSSVRAVGLDILAPGHGPIGGLGIRLESSGRSSCSHMHRCIAPPCACSPRPCSVRSLGSHCRRRRRLSDRAAAMHV